MKKLIIAKLLVAASCGLSLAAFGSTNNSYLVDNDSDGTIYAACGSGTSRAIGSGSSPVNYSCSGDVRVYDSGGTNYDSVGPSAGCMTTEVSVTGSASDPTISTSCY